MDENRRQFIAGMAAIAGIIGLDGSGLLKASLAIQPASKAIIGKPSRNIKDYPHITDVIPSKDIKRYFPIIVDACSDPETNYLSKIPFLIELEVCKMWSESRFEWDALSTAGAAGLPTAGFPIRKSQDQSSFDSSPGLIAAYRVLHRLITPRHPPCTLRNLITFAAGRVC